MWRTSVGQDPGGREAVFGLTTLRGRSDGVCSVSLQCSARAPLPQSQSHLCRNP